jgi:hypothetical protein
MENKKIKISKKRIAGHLRPKNKLMQSNEIKSKMI